MDEILDNILLGNRIIDKSANIRDKNTAKSLNFLYKWE